MASIVYYTNPKTGAVTAYRSEAKWDPEKGYSVPKRTYLGRVDPITKEIIPSSGKRGRKKKEETMTPDSLAYKMQLEAATAEMNQLRETVSNLQKQVRMLEKKRDDTAKAMQELQQLINKLMSRL